MVNKKTSKTNPFRIPNQLMYKYLVSLLLVLLCAHPSCAQERADSLMQAYDFASAAKILRSRLASARQSGSPTAELSLRLGQAELGARMLEATERVVFLDSVVLAADEVTGRLRLTPHSGRLCTAAEYFPDGLPQGIAVETRMFANDFGDRLLLALPDSTGLLKLHASRLLAGRWAAPEPLPGLEEAGEIQDYPFMMPDGQTLYFAAQGKESLGGFDIFATRYNPDTGRYLKPARLGFPFNSTANDYHYCIDEAAGVGYFVTDRGQQPGTVCLYAFIPNTSHDIYLLNDANADSVRRAARIACIDELGAGSEEAAAARRKARQALNAARDAELRPVRIVIDDSHVYTDPAALRNETARRIATEYVSRVRELDEVERTLDGARQTYAADPGEEIGAYVLSLESKADTLRATIKRLATNMRRAELGTE